MRVRFSPLFVPAACFTPRDSPGSLFTSDYTSAFPTLLHVVSSLHVAVEISFWKSLGHFFFFPHRCDCYLSVSMGQCELRNLLFHYLPQKSQTYIAFLDFINR